MLSGTVAGIATVVPLVRVLRSDNVIASSPAKNRRVSLFFFNGPACETANVI